MPKRTRTYESWQMEKLVDPVRAASYLNATLQESPENFLSALEKVAKANDQAEAAASALSGQETEQTKRILGGVGEALHLLGLQISVAPVVKQHEAEERSNSHAESAA